MDAVQDTQIRIYGMATCMDQECSTVLRGSNKARRLRLFPFTLDHTWATEENTQLEFFKSDSYANLFQLLFFPGHPPRSPPWNRGGVALGLSLLTGQSECLQNSIDGERLSIELCR